MPRLIYYVASSLDGYIADENGGVDWLPDPVEGEDFGYGEFYDGIDALLMGRRTYDQVRGFGDWPRIREHLARGGRRARRPLS